MPRVIKTDNLLRQTHQGTTVPRTALHHVCPLGLLDSVTPHTATLSAVVGMPVGMRHPAVKFILKMKTATVYGGEMKRVSLGLILQTE